MRQLRSVLLRHDRSGDSHDDWMIEHPDCPPGVGPLVTFRMPIASGLRPGRWVVQRLPDHRRAYLRYQGPVSNGRGRVRRIASGHVRVIRWTSVRVHLQLDLGRRAMRVMLDRIAGDTWSATIRSV